MVNNCTWKPDKGMRHGACKEKQKKQTKQALKMMHRTLIVASRAVPHSVISLCIPFPL